MNPTKLYKIIMADDHILLRDALANLITGFDEFTVIAKAANGMEVINLIKNGEEADIILMDLNMPEMDGYETAKLLAKMQPKLKIIILTMYEAEMLLMRLLQVGVKGFLKKDIHPHELNNALLTVATGEYYYDNRTTEKMVSIFRDKTDQDLAMEEIFLDETEIEFIKLSCTNMIYKDIARAMNLPVRYIENYRLKLHNKLRIETRVELAIYAVKNGIILF
jgi:two-component system, NarL family, invasion response regulator UvrY